METTETTNQKNMTTMKAIVNDIYIPFLQKYKLFVGLYVFLIIIMYILQTIIIPSTVTSLIEKTLLVSPPNKENLEKSALYLCLLLFVFIVICYFKNLFDAILPVAQFTMIRTMMYNRMLELMETNVKSIRMGELITIINYLPREIRYLSDNIINLAPGLISYAMIVITYVGTEWRTGMILLLGFVGTLWFLTKSDTVKQLAEKCLKRSEMTLQSNTKIGEDMMQVDQIMAYNLLADKIRENNDREEVLHQHFTQSATLSNQIFSIMQTWNIIIFILAGFVLYRSRPDPHIFRTYVVVITSFLGVLYAFITRSTYYINVYTSVQVFYHAFLEMVDKSGASLGNSTLLSAATSSPFSESLWRIEFRDLSFSYKEDSPPVLTGMNWTIQPGSKWILQGPSGRGKSTLLRLMMRFYEPSSGSIRINDIPLQELNVREMRQSILYIHQDTPMFEKTIEENIRIRHGTTIQNAQIIETLEKYSLLHILAEQKTTSTTTTSTTNNHNILNRSCGVDGKSLSKGQQKIIILARSLLSVPETTKLILIDEPFASLDQTSRQGVLRWIHDILQQRPNLSVVMTSHILEDPQWIENNNFQVYSL